MSNSDRDIERDMDRLAWHIELHGLVGKEEALRNVVQLARTSGASRLLADVLADRTEPEVARIRAFGLLALQIAARRPVQHALAAA